MTTYISYDEASTEQRRAAFDALLAEQEAVAACMVGSWLTMQAREALALLVAAPPERFTVEIRPTKSGETYWYDGKWRVAVADGTKDLIVKVQP